MVNNMNISIIKQQEVLGKDFAIYGTFEEPLFLAKDVANWIEHSNARMMVKSIDEEDKVVNNVYTLGGSQETLFVTEDGLYEILMQSRKPIAKKFKKEVKAILKEIRMHGGYISTNEEETDEMILSKALRIMERTIEKRDKLIAEQKELIELQQYDVELVERFVKSKDDSLVRDVAKVLNDKGMKVTEGMLFAKLIEWRYAYREKSSGKYRPTQRGIEYGLLVLTQVEKDGKVHRTMKVTPKGQERIFKRLKQESQVDLQDTMNI
ncbi:antirepressor [Lysinibacillus phage vB_LspM-01]|nr:antirepressor [Lysinibacillus phage vB_LspM-01]